MRFLIYGAGSVGSTIGGMLAHAGHSVLLVGRDPHMKRIAASGLHISGLWGTYDVKNIETALTIPSDFEPDWIFLTTKSFDTAAAAEALHQIYPASIPILHIQNGIGNAEALIDRFGQDRVTSAMIIIGFTTPLAGRTVVTVQADSIKIGRVDGKMTESVQAITRLMSDAKMPVEAVSNVQTHLWGKVLYNASLNPLGAILSVPYGKLLDPYPWSVIREIVQEAYTVLKAENQTVFWKSAEEYLSHLRRVQIPATFDHEPSMLADVRHGHRTEIDFINGALVRLADKHHLHVPANALLCTLIHALEHNGKVARLRSEHTIHK